MRSAIAPVSGSGGVGLGHPPLQLQGAGDRVHGAGELDQHAVAHELDDAAAMVADDRLEDGDAPLLQGRKRAGLVRLHQAAVADHVGHQHGGQAAVHGADLSVERRV